MSSCDHCVGLRMRPALRDLIAHLDAAIFDLDLALLETEQPEVVALQLQALIDFAQQRLDDARRDG